MKHKTKLILCRSLALSLYSSLIIYFFINVDYKSFHLELSLENIITHSIATFIFSIATNLFFLSLSYKLFFFFFFLNFLFPVFSPFFFLSLMVTLIFSKKMDLLNDFHEESAPKDLNYETTTGFKESIQNNVNVEPLVECVRSHNTPADIKRGAIETLTNMGNNVAVSLLKECLGDPNTEVRFYASSGLSRIEEGLNKRIIELKDNVKKQEVTTDDFINLGHAYYQFVELQIQDHASTNYYLGMAIENYQQALERDKVNEEYQHILHKSYIKAGRIVEANLLEEKISSFQHDTFNVAESLFKEGKITECIDLLKQLPDDSEQIRDIKEMWLKPKT